MLLWPPAAGRKEANCGPTSIRSGTSPLRPGAIVVADPRTRKSAIIDPVLDFDAKSGKSSTATADTIAAFVRDQSLTNLWILETHAHADHLSAAPYLQAAVGGQIAIGKGIRDVQKAFRVILNLEPEFPVDGRQFDKLLADGDEFYDRFAHRPRDRNSRSHERQPELSDRRRSLCRRFDLHAGRRHGALRFPGR